MKHLIFVGMLLVASHAWGQSPDGLAGAPALCAPFAGYASDLVRFVDEQKATGVASASSSSSGAYTNEAMLRAAAATLACAQSAVHLWTQPKAKAELSTVERRFETGTATSDEVSAARVAVAKAVYCETAFSEATRSAEHFQRRMEVGLVSRAGVAPILAVVETLIPFCGSSA